MDPESVMRQAIAAARRGIEAGQSPFGCAIAMGARVIACEHNTVLATTDITAHAEVTALRVACHAVDRVLLAGAIVASTCEPCPMCMAALHWARVDTVYFGASIADAAAAGFNELRVPAAQLLELGSSKVRIVPNVLRDECRVLFDQWRDQPGHQVY